METISCYSSPKNKKPSSLSDFHPISLLCHLSKIFERIVFDQLSALFLPAFRPSPNGLPPRQQHSNHAHQTRWCQTGHRTKDGHPARPVFLRPSTLFVIISSWINSLIFVFPVPSSIGSSPTSLADLNAFVIRMAYPIHSGHPFLPAFLRVWYSDHFYLRLS